MYETIISVVLFAIALYTAAQQLEPEKKENTDTYDPNKQPHKRTQVVRSYQRVVG